MKFADRLRKDKKFRWNMILIFTAIVLITGNVPSEVKKEAPLQATCDQFNDFALTTNVNACINAGCAVTAPDYKFGFDFVECVQAGFENLGLYCNNHPNLNLIKTFLAEDLNQANDLCGIGKKAIDSVTNFCFKTLYTCTDIPESEQCGNELQNFFGDIGNSIPW